VLVVIDRPDELLLQHFWLITNWTAEQCSGADLLDHYRTRGCAEGYMGELMNVAATGAVVEPAQRDESVRLLRDQRGDVTAQRAGLQRHGSSTADAGAAGRRKDGA